MEVGNRLSCWELHLPFIHNLNKHDSISNSCGIIVDYDHSTFLILSSSLFTDEIF